MTDPSYPIGKYEPKPFSEKQKKEWLLVIQTLPARIEYAVTNLDEAQLQTPYRKDGWTVHQLVHHIADSHANAYIRFKLCLTEDKPVIKPYDQDAWAELDDTKNLPINISLTMLHAFHLRLHELLKNLDDVSWDRTVVHPEHNKEMSLWYLLGMYAWHGLHHEAHINELRKQKGW